MNNSVFYLTAFLCAALVTTLCLPFLRCVLANVLVDVPGGLKQHANAVPMVGGPAIFVGTLTGLVLIRLITNFPTGTLHSLRGLLGAGALIFTLGLVDDLRKPKGLPVAIRLCVQAVATLLLIYYGIYIQIFSAWWVNYSLTFLWLIGLTNAFNLLDIMDGLCISQALICATGLLVIAWPGELGYVNFAAAVLLGACLAFWPHNHRQPKIFLGDSGATFVGFFIAALTLATQYSRQNVYGYAAPFFIAAVPLLDTAFVSLARLLQGKNPLQGSPDHLALRLKAKWNFSNKQVLATFGLIGILCNIWAYELTKCSAENTPALLVISALGAGMFLLWLLQKLGTLRH